ncbi:DedA family protein [Sphingomonas sp.]|uniref:DedA family protein n=1 Tax=Sphingomonas sp. TaxID=28214 RepID=UPI003B00EF46
MTDFILDAITQAGYLGIFLLMALENIVPPIPSEVIMGLAGMAVARGDMALVPLVLVGTAGTTAGNCFWYWLGVRFGYERFRPFVERHGRWLTLDWSGVERLHAFFVRHGGWVIFVFRFMPAFRTIVSLPAGMTRMPLFRFLVWTFAGSLIWNTVLAEAGVLLGSRFQDLHRYVGPATIAVFVAMAVGYAWRVATWKPD